MTRRNSTSSSHSSEPDRPDAVNALQFATSALEYQQQMLRFTSLAADAMRLFLHQTQRQMEYINTLSQCRDFAAMGAVTAEFAQKMGKEVSTEWQQVSRMSEHWMESVSQSNQRMTEALKANGTRTGSAH